MNIHTSVEENGGNLQKSKKYVHNQALLVKLMQVKLASFAKQDDLASYTMQQHVNKQSWELFSQLNLNPSSDEQKHFTLTGFCTKEFTESAVRPSKGSQLLQPTDLCSYSSVSMLSSLEDTCLAPDSDSRLGFPTPASTRTSGGASKRRVGDSDRDDMGRLYAKMPIGWSNLQLGPNLQMP